MQVSLQYATEHLNELAMAADNGEDVEIARPEKPLLKLTATEQTPRRELGGRRILGALRGQITVPSEEEWRKMHDELANFSNSLRTTGAISSSAEHRSGSSPRK